MKTRSSPHKSGISRTTSRRQLLRAAGKATLVMTALGLGGVSLAAGQQRVALAPTEQARLDLIQYAIKNVDMEGAIKKFSKGANLDAKGLSILRKLSKTDLRALRSIQEKLGLSNGLIYIRY